MRCILVILLFLVASCKKEQKKDNPDRAALHGVWESYAIRSKEPGPPIRVVLEITAYNKTKLTYLKMTSYGANNQQIEKTIRISLDEKGYIVPAIVNEMNDKKTSNRFIWRNEKGKSAKIQKAYKAEVQQLKWKYSLSGKDLTIQMGPSKVKFSKRD